MGGDYAPYMEADFIFCLRPILIMITYMPIRIREESKQITEVFSFYDLNVDTAIDKVCILIHFSNSSTHW
jgi:hypothetical protein